MIIKEIQIKSIVTKSNLPVCDYSINPYAGCPHGCRYCYASFMKRFTGHTEPWGSFLDVKYWEPLKRVNKYDGKSFFIGSVTDPYNPLEAKYHRTRAFLEELKGCDARISIQTKSDLVLEDKELIKSFHDARVGFSINTLDESFKDEMDQAVSIERRLEAMKILRDEGIRTTCFVSPIFPGITDVQTIIERVKDQCNLIWLENLNLRGDYKKVILDHIKDKHAELYPLYEAIYIHNDRSYWEALDKKLKGYAKEKGYKYVRNMDIEPSFEAKPVIVNFFYHEQIKKSAKKSIIG